MYIEELGRTKNYQFLFRYSLGKSGCNEWKNDLGTTYCLIYGSSTLLIFDSNFILPGSEYFRTIFLETTCI